MKIIDKVRLQGNKKLLLLLNLFSLPLTYLFFLLFTQIAIIFKPLINKGTSINTSGIVTVMGMVMALLVIHELVHGLFYNLFKPKNRIKIGFRLKSMIGYCTSPYSLYPKSQMLVIGLAPFFLLSFSLTLLYCLGILSPFYYIFLAAVHAGGCIGDFYYVYLLVFKFKQKEILIEDTLSGLIIYQK
ncbi:DUF3267 domain-containing protein [Streptococcus uberis]|uniref:DUF3267 domain-containing protein n=1 Tax=Streptococcus uberis TaxID=1349 RepID=UPI001FF162DC|nr:DUF3267 domain-containing protein [Streptococcus uberis]MCK1159720.1 DUF3267 domain-containing protein [Streptococcus uberis]MCK1161499.1 DUF3267 domain-containing protein [Streptococcus uberis]MCK1165251.1 DUF3267 domain-containing protein [Streptococcus uberis]MCK1195150.1 DUF3267 domain-containing protein [Streptococcus uberis]MCK1233404.1 DUF3267 domain-containing protein [Streptococcus uberis]